MTVVSVLAVLVVVSWWLFTAGPLRPNRSMEITANVNAPKDEQPITPEQPPAAK